MIGSQKLKNYDSSIFGRPSFAYSLLTKFAVPGSLILNIGSGNGWFESKCLREGFARIISLDITFENLKYVRKNLTPSHCINTKVENLPFKQNSFDIIFFSEVLEHVDKNFETKVITELYHSLKPDGTLILTTPNNFFLTKILDPAWYFGHRHYDVQSVISLLEINGFSVINAEIRGGISASVDDLIMYISKWLFNIEPHLLKFLTKYSKFKFYNPRSKLSKVHTIFILAKKCI